APVAWREHIRSSGRTPNGVWGGKLMWNQTALLRRRASELPDRSGDTLSAAIRDVIGSEPVYVHVYRPDAVSQAVSFWRAVQTQVWRGGRSPVRDRRDAPPPRLRSRTVLKASDQVKNQRGLCRQGARPPPPPPNPPLCDEPT